MPRTFLPKLRADGVYTPPEFYRNAFVGGPESLIGDIHKSMEVSEANSEGRAPSPFARVWQFRRSLAGETGEHERVRAIAAFRGIVALFALRDFYHLKVTVDVTPRLTQDRLNGATSISELFEVHTSYLPQPTHAAQARFLFGHCLVLFRLKEPSGTPDSVFAGFSPLTLFYPAARSLENSLALRAIFWYDPREKCWRDPTQPSGSTQGRLLQEARTHLAVWLDDVLANQADGQRLAILADANLAAEDDRFLARLLTDWRGELRSMVAERGAQVRRMFLEKSPQLQEAEQSAGNPFLVPQLLEKVYFGTNGRSDFKTRAGALVLSLDAVAIKARRIYGNVFGSDEASAKLGAAPAKGPDLGVALGRPGEAPVPYVTLDKLFCRKLGKLHEGKNKISPEWVALTLDNSNLAGIFLLPFEPSILEYFSHEEIRTGTEAKNSIVAVEVRLRNEAVGVDIRRNYIASSEIVKIDQSLDLRFFPNFCLDQLVDPNRQLPFPEDRNYYARIRLSPDFDTLPMRWLGAAGEPLANVTSYFAGNFQKPTNTKLYALGRQAFWRLPMATPPAAFQLEGFGLILLDLKRSERADQFVQPWKVGLDFGTTNSCVAIDVGAQIVESAYELPVFTTTFLEKWQTDLRGDSDESVTAWADFMFWQNTATHVLNENEFFPTQILTRHNLNLAELPFSQGFDERNGLAFFKNVSLLAVETNISFTDLIVGFEGMRETGVQARFNLNRGLKWRDEDDQDKGGHEQKSLVWRRVFHQHLRLHLVLAAARKNAYIENLIASYPKAFTPDEIFGTQGYKNALDEIWGTPNPDHRNPRIRKSSTTVELRSESAAAAMALEILLGQEFFLLDMGGGTTDIAVFKNNALEEECSLTLAGNVLEQYVYKSSALRRLIAGVFGVDDRKAAFGVADRQELIYQTLFQGFLVKNGARALSDLRKSGRDDVSAQGFFLSAIFLYTGLAYFCGLWLKRRRQDRKGINDEERLQWLGNGSGFIQMLAVGNKEFEEILVKIFNIACAGSAKPATPRLDPKTIIAKGLLKRDAITASNTDRRVFSDLLSNSVTLDGRMRTETESLSSFYEQFTINGVVTWDGLSEGKVFRGYLEALQGLLPRTVFNQTVLVNLGVFKLESTSNWAVDYMTAHRSSFEKKFLDRLKRNERRWGNVARAGAQDTLYVEPIFISELAALLEQLRENCAR